MQLLKHSPSGDHGGRDGRYDFWRARRDVERMVYDYISRNEDPPFELYRVKKFLDDIDSGPSASHFSNR